jgi:hypothetical protein
MCCSYTTDYMAHRPDSAGRVNARLVTLALLQGFPLLPANDSKTGIKPAADTDATFVTRHCLLAAALPMSYLLPLLLAQIVKAMAAAFRDFSSRWSSITSLPCHSAYSKCLALAHHNSHAWGTHCHFPIYDQRTSRLFDRSASLHYLIPFLD